MSVVCNEKPKGRQLNGVLAGRKARREYIIVGATDEADAKLAMAGVVPALLDGLVLDAVDVTETHNGIYDGVANWITATKKEEKEEEQKEREIGSVVVNFDTTGGTAHKTHSEGTTSYGTNAPDNNGLIGVTDDGVAGVDVPAPAFAWTEEWKMARTDMTWSFARRLSKMTGMLNDAAFRTFAVGEVRFLGATESSDGDDAVRITFKFEASISVENITIGDITGIYKPGWDYLETRYSSKNNNNRLTKKPIGVYVHRVSELGDFSELGIGVAEIDI